MLGTFIDTIDLHVHGSRHSVVISLTSGETGAELTSPSHSRPGRLDRQPDHVTRSGHLRVHHIGRLELLQRACLAIPAWREVHRAVPDYLVARTHCRRHGQVELHLAACRCAECHDGDPEFDRAGGAQPRCSRRRASSVTRGKSEDNPLGGFLYGPGMDRSRPHRYDERGGVEHQPDPGEQPDRAWHRPGERPVRMRWWRFPGGAGIFRDLRGTMNTLRLLFCWLSL